MDMYSGTQAMGTVPVAPLAEWAAPGGETGLEEPMWQLGIGGGPDLYPERPGEPDCMYYLRTGFCGYGNRCRFNHPRDRSMKMGAFRAGGEDFPERVGQPLCQYYMRTGTCKFGAFCRYNHPKHGIGSSGPVTLNIYGYPLRLGEKECSYYVKTGHCKFGLTCKFHHPQPAQVSVPVAAAGAGPLTAPPAVYPSGPSLSSVQSSQQYGVIHGNWAVARPAILPGTYVPGSYGPMLLPPGVVPVSEWAPYPGALLCSHYAQNGVCKFGPTCRFDHPMRTLTYSPSASSLTNVSVAPYPVGHTTHASSDSHLSGLNKSTFSSSQLSLMNTTRASVSEQDLQPSAQGPKNSSS